MAELTIRPEEIRDALDSFVQSYEPGAASREEVGQIARAAAAVPQAPQDPQLGVEALGRHRQIGRAAGRDRVPAEEDRRVRPVLQHAVSHA